jgi:hypothetical protein
VPRTRRRARRRRALPADRSAGRERRGSASIRSSSSSGTFLPVNPHRYDGNGIALRSQCFPICTSSAA